jgi:hypothetical protein
MTLLVRFGCVRRFSASVLTVIMSVGAVLVCATGTGADDNSVAWAGPLAPLVALGEDAVRSCGAEDPVAAAATLAEALAREGGAGGAAAAEAGGAGGSGGAPTKEGANATGAEADACVGLTLPLVR